MQKNNYRTFKFSAEDGCSDSYFMSAYDTHTTQALTAIITLMAVLLHSSVFSSPVIDILISMTLGVIILVIVRGKSSL